MHHIESEYKPWRSILTYALVILPSAALGLFGMISGGVPPALWGQHAAAFFLFPLLFFLRRQLGKVSPNIRLTFMLLFLACTLLFPGVNNVRRWLDLGPLNVNGAMLALPSLLLLLGRLKRPHPSLLFIGAILCLQPDLSQLTAFSLGIMPILWRCRKKVRMTAATLILLAIFVIRCFYVPISLEPVEYCEGIMGMVGKISPIMPIAGWLSLALIPGYFLYRFSKDKSVAKLCLAIYYAVSILFSFTGEYPVPFMGLGLSPMAGYWLALSLFSQTIFCRPEE